MDSNNIYSQWLASQNGRCGQGKYDEKEMCKIGVLDRSVEEHYIIKLIYSIKLIYNNFQSFN